VIRRHLGDIRILAKEAFEIAAYCGDGIGIAARQEMKERLLFNRVYMFGYYLPIDQTDEYTATVLSNMTNASRSLFNKASMVAKKTPDFAVIHFFIEIGFFHHGQPRPHT
jgi:hypothetical protein